MAKFTLSVLNNYGETILTDYDAQTARTNGLTFNETASLSTEGPTLNFSMLKYYYEGSEKRVNTAAMSLFYGSTIKLLTNGQRYDFSVNKIDYQFMQDNLQLNFSATNAFQFETSNQGVGYTIEADTSDPTFLGAQSIDFWARKIVADNNLRWTYVAIDKANDTLIHYLSDQATIVTRDTINEDGEMAWSEIEQDYAVEPQKNLATLNAQVSFSCSNSNAYAALKQLATDNELFIVVDYGARNFWFSPIKNPWFKGYYFNPNNNLQEFSLSGNGANLVSVLNVQGPTDYNDQLITLVPEIPPTVRTFIQSPEWKESVYTPTMYQELYDGVKKTTLDDAFLAQINQTPWFENKLINIDYFKESGILLEFEANQIYDIFYNQLRIVNAPMIMRYDDYIKQSERDYMTINDRYITMGRLDGDEHADIDFIFNNLDINNYPYPALIKAPSSEGDAIYVRTPLEIYASTGVQNFLQFSSLDAPNSWCDIPTAKTYGWIDYELLTAEPQLVDAQPLLFQFNGDIDHRIAFKFQSTRDSHSRFGYTLEINDANIKYFAGLFIPSGSSTRICDQVGDPISFNDFTIPDTASITVMANNVIAILNKDNSWTSGNFVGIHQQDQVTIHCYGSEQVGIIKLELSIYGFVKYTLNNEDIFESLTPSSVSYTFTAHKFENQYSLAISRSGAEQEYIIYIPPIEWRGISDIYYGQFARPKEYYNTIQLLKTPVNIRYIDNASGAYTTYDPEDKDSNNIITSLYNIYNSFGVASRQSSEMILKENTLVDLDSSLTQYLSTYDNAWYQLLEAAYNFNQYWSQQYQYYRVARKIGILSSSTADGLWVSNLESVSTNNYILGNSDGMDTITVTFPAFSDWPAFTLSTFQDGEYEIKTPAPGNSTYGILVIKDHIVSIQQLTTNRLAVSISPSCPKSTIDTTTITPEEIEILALNTLSRTKTIKQCAGISAKLTEYWTIMKNSAAQLGLYIPTDWNCLDILEQSSYDSLNNIYKNQLPLLKKDNGDIYLNPIYGGRVNHTGIKQRKINYKFINKDRNDLQFLEPKQTNTDTEWVIVEQEDDITSYFYKWAYHQHNGLDNIKLFKQYTKYYQTQYLLNNDTIPQLNNFVTLSTLLQQWIGSVILPGNTESTINYFNSLYVPATAFITWLAQYQETDYSDLYTLQAKHNAIWRNLYHDYPGVFRETVYENTDASTSLELYQAARKQLQKLSRPEFTYNLTGMDIYMHDVDYNPLTLQIGDQIRIDYEEDAFKLDSLNKALREPLYVTAIDRTLRNDGDYRFSVITRYATDTMLQRFAQLLNFGRR